MRAIFEDLRDGKPRGLKFPRNAVFVLYGSCGKFGEVFLLGKHGFLPSLYGKIQLVKRRIFIAVPIPLHARAALAEALFPIEEKIRDHARIVSEMNWHFTLVFIGEVGEEIVPCAIDAVKKVFGEAREPIKLSIDKIAYGPSDRMKRMIWICGSQASSEKLGEIQKPLMRELKSLGVPFKNEFRDFRAHITFARLYAGDFAFPRLPDIKPISFEADEVVVMESHLSRSGAEYDEIFKIKL